MPSALGDAEITSGLSTLSGWQRDGDAIVKAYECASFADAVAFVVRIGFLAEKANHHPDLDVRWRTVRVVLSSHDAGGITERDFSLAQEIEAIPGAS
jgi:4a-hydroxytetrahydrobiopterin dehydratase